MVLPAQNFISLLFFSDWISLLQSQTVEVQPGGDATLLCSNFSSSSTQIIWFRLVNQTQAHCILSIYIPTDPVSFCNGIRHGKFEVTSNISTVFLKIKHTDLFDSGFYFCGFYFGRHQVIVNSTFLKVHGKNDVACLIRADKVKQISILLFHSQIEELGSCLKKFEFLVYIKCGHVSSRRSW